MEVFKKASLDLYRVDRHWRAVIDAQLTILEELGAKPQRSRSRSPSPSAKSPLDIALGDFKFTLNKAIESTYQR